MRKNNKLKLAGMIVKGVTGVLGGSLVLSNEHPYIALTVLAIGAAANEYILYLKEDNK